MLSKQNLACFSALLASYGRWRIPPVLSGLQSFSQEKSFVAPCTHSEKKVEAHEGWGFIFCLLRKKITLPNTWCPITMFAIAKMSFFPCYACAQALVNIRLGSQSCRVSTLRSSMAFSTSARVRASPFCSFCRTATAKVSLARARLYQS